VPVRATSHYTKRATPHQNKCIIPTSTRRNFINMDPIEAAIAAIESREPGEQFSYREVAKRFSVNRTTLSRRHRGVAQSRATVAQQQQLLNPPIEAELLKYIERLTEKGLPPTREMVSNFAGAVGERDGSDAWVTRFLHRHHLDLTIK
jgi:transposase-like protein